MGHLWQYQRRNKEVKPLMMGLSEEYKELVRQSLQWQFLWWFWSVVIKMILRWTLQWRRLTWSSASLSSGWFSTSSRFFRHLTGWFYLDLHICWKPTQIILIIVIITRWWHLFYSLALVNISNSQGRGEEQSEKYCNEARNSQNWRRRLFGLVSPFSGVSLHIYIIYHHIRCHH